MTPTMTTERQKSAFPWRLALLLGTAAGACLLVAALPRLPQSAGYHHFADTAVLWGLPNAANVLSNAAFIVAGTVGLWRCRHMSRSLEALIWRFFYTAVASVGLGSAWYHWQPESGSLLWDRLPMTLGFASLTAGLAAERFGRRAGCLLLAPLIIAGAGSVLYWWLTERAGAGDLRPYIVVQYLPMLLVPLTLLLFPGEGRGNRPYWLLLAAYAAAKIFEWQDGAIYALTGQLISGHTLKHLVAAAGLLAFRPQAVREEGREAREPGKSA